MQHMAGQDLHTLFSDTDGDFYATSELNQRLNLILYLLENSEQLLFVMAEAGYGKTTLLNQVIAGAQNNWRIFTPAGSPELTKTRLLASLLSAFNVRHEGKPEHVLYETLRSHIAATHYNNQIPILVVDDAHMLPLDTLSLIVDLVMRGESRTRLRVLLFCEPQINSVLAAPEFEIVRNTLTNTLDIPPFSEKQVRNYIQWRLQKAPFAPNNLFSNDVLRKIYHESEGTPGLVNELAQTVIDEGLAESPSPALGEELDEDVDFPATWVAGIVILLVVILFGIYQIKDQLLGQSGEEGTETSIISLPPPLPDEDSSLQAPVPGETLVPEIDLETELDTEASPALDELAAENKYDEHDSLPGVKTGVWLLKQPANAYTIQLFGNQNWSAISEFITRNQQYFEPPYPLTSYPTAFRNGDTNWYVVTYGIFPSYEEANAVRAELPWSVKMHDAWIKPLSKVHEEIGEE